MTRSRLDELETFAVVATTGSFAAAGRCLGLSPSAVSRLVARLEARLGVRLVERSTHGLALTPEGECFVSGATAVLDTLERVEASVRGDAAALAGPLRITVSAPLAIHVVTPDLALFRERYPRIALRFLVSDSVVDLLAERADLALRIGELQDSALKCRSLGSTRLLRVAAPALVADAGVEGLREEGDLSLGTAASAKTSSPFGVVTDSGEHLRHLALAGLGVARLAAFHVAADLERGDLVVLPWTRERPAVPVSALHLAHREASPRVAAFVAHLRATMPERLRSP